jgi:hypothetical protein
VKLHTKLNKHFFEGTAVATEAAKVVTEAATRSL